MIKKIALINLSALIIILFTTTTVFAGIFHYNTSTQNLTLANLLDQNPNTTDPENLWVIAAIIVMAIIYMLIDKVKAGQKADSQIS